MLFQSIVPVRVVHKIILISPVSLHLAKGLYDQMIGADLQGNIVRKAQRIV